MKFDEETAMWMPEEINLATHLKRSSVIEYIMGIHTGLRRVVVQAGGHLGVWPYKLSTHFDSVVTFEAIMGNWEFLVRNSQGCRILPIYGAVGSFTGKTAMSIGKYTGGSHIAVGENRRDVEVPQYTIDLLPMSNRIDAIVLDIEGMEIEALTGAKAAILANYPTIVVEENSCAKRYGYKPGHIAKFLSDYGYKKAGEYLEDVVYVSELRNGS